MKLYITALIVILPLISAAQKSNYQDPAHTKTTPTVSLTIEKPIQSAQKAIIELSTLLQLSEESNLKLLHSIDSPNGHHYTFIHTFKEFEVFQSHIKLNTDLKGNVTTLFSSYHPISNYANPQATKRSLLEFSKQITGELVESKLTWKLVNETYELLRTYQLLDNMGNFTQQFYNAEDELLEQIDLLNHYTEVDTTAKALVFSPNPVTSALTTYGGNYIDNNDAASPELNTEQDTAIIDLTYTNGLFILENEFVKIQEHSLPVVPPVTSAFPEFFYDRSESGFEDVNAFHHITEQQKYIQSLGFTNIVNYQIHVDCHGFNGADNSSFSSGTNPPTLVFGEGGVDDAEDADVIIHEYTHAVMHSASPGTNFGSERNAMDEAFGDYMAVSYSMKYTNFHSDWAFKWDGHNEFWDGRLTISDKTYPNDLVFNLYSDAPMWSSALTRIERNLGRDLTITLAIEAAYSFVSNMTMAQAADLYITTDNLINNGENYATICWVFKDRGMINSCAVPKPGNLVGVSNLNSNPTIQINNTENFAAGRSNLSILSESTFQIKVFDITGKLLFEKSEINSPFEISPAKWNTSTLLIEVTNKTEVKSFKILSPQ
ncbi:MAG: hypothetical protein ACI85Q_001499 [Salibacteraceae bacterium]|jgi:hypothetical protein